MTLNHDPVCLRCGDSGIVLDAPYWDSCSCAAGVHLSAEIARGQQQIAAGEFVRLDDLMRTTERLERMAAGYFG